MTNVVDLNEARLAKADREFEKRIVIKPSDALLLNDVKLLAECERLVALLGRPMDDVDRAILKLECLLNESRRQKEMKS